MPRSQIIVFFSAFILLLATPLVAQTVSTPLTRVQADFFEKRIRPLLVTKCLSCHGAKKQKSGLRLDSRAAILKGSAEGPVINRKDVKRSSLIQVLNYSGEIKMPPKEKLAATEIVDFTKWINMGLPWPKSTTLNAGNSATAGKNHWAFQPIRSPRIPTVRQQGWSQTPFDQFILSRLEIIGLKPSPRASRRTLIRRATFDLTGLPPTPKDVAVFLKDASPNAYAKMIDRLLASPRYGERWARLWLDVARYADNKGYVFFEDKNFPWAYTYRDYVIRSFNQDLPYDRFVIEQLAADQLPNGSDKSYLAAMGFLTLGGRFMNNTHDVIDDRIDVMTRGLMGITVTCARCHDHKFDPITQSDYYGLYGVFRSSIEPTVRPLITPAPKTEEYRKFTAGLNERTGKLNAFINKKYIELVKSSKTRVGDYLLRADSRRNQPNTESFMLLTPAGDLHPAMIERWERYLAKAQRNSDPVWTIWNRYSKLPRKNFEQQAARLTEELRRDALKKASINRELLRAFLGKPIRSMKDVADRYAELLKSVDQQWETQLAKSRTSKKSPPLSLQNPDREKLRLVFYGPNAPPNIPKRMGWGFLSLLPDRPAQGIFKKLIKEVENWSVRGPGAPPRAMVLVDSPEPYRPHVFLRGNPNRLGVHVEKRFPQALQKNGQPFRNGSGRLELAKSVVDSQNPLTPRVLINRIWLHHFGHGIVETPSDFGLRSTPPSHPLLLDYLSSEFMRCGWSIKRTHRLIMMSATYQQQSQDRVACRKLDSENRFYWRMNRRRLGFEAMRDALLAVSGSTGQKIGGPPMVILNGRHNPRRTIYGFIDRMNLPGLHRTFDFPSPSATSPKRETTTIPPQALFFMNHTLVRETSRRILFRSDFTKEATTAGKLTRLYAVLFGRPPENSERTLANEFLGSKPQPKQWQYYVQALLMSNEFLFID